MPYVSLVFGLLLIGVSLWSNSVSETRSMTIWIPAIVGILLVICGLIGSNESRLKHAMHTAATIGLLGGIAAASRFVPKLFGEINWKDVPTRATGAMTLLCFTFVGLCVLSFIQARRRRAASDAARNP